MLVRWQGSGFVSNAVSYNVSDYTAYDFTNTSPFTGPTVGSLSTWQRGVQPESDYYGTPAVQLYCNGGGMFINTWWVPHQVVVGGGYNDMFGYQWVTNTEPPAFYTILGTVIPTSLIVQANIAVPLYEPYVPTGSSSVPNGQVSLFAYVKDSSHPSNPPIALVAYTHTSGSIASVDNPGYVSCDYSPGGVYFASGSTTFTTSYMTHDSASTNAQQISYSYNPSASALFYRMQVTPTNMSNIVSVINAGISGCSGLPTNYSTDPTDYVVKYAGIIAEPTISNDVNSSTLNDSSITQVSEGVNFYNLGIYKKY